jgi:hypothetical protein
LKPMTPVLKLLNTVCVLAPKSPFVPVFNFNHHLVIGNKMKILLPSVDTSLFYPFVLVNNHTMYACRHKGQPTVFLPSVNFLFNLRVPRRSYLMTHNRLNNYRPASNEICIYYSDTVVSD